MGELLLAALTGTTRIVAVCEGHAVAAGAMLLLVADVRIGARGSYTIGFTEPRLGMPLPELPAVLIHPLGQQLAIWIQNLYPSSVFSVRSVFDYILSTHHHRHN